MTDRALRLLGIMKKANAIEPGETKTGAAAKQKTAVLLVLAGDSSDNALHRITNFSATNESPMVRVPYTKDEIADAIGAEICSMFAIKDLGFAVSFLRYTEEERSVSYPEAELLEEKKKMARAGRQGKKRSKQGGLIYELGEV